MCNCWDCLRSRGITPKREDAHRHRRLYPRHIMRTDNGEPDHGEMAAEKKRQEEAERQEQVAA